MINECCTLVLKERLNDFLQGQTSIVTNWLNSEVVSATINQYIDLKHFENMYAYGIYDYYLSVIAEEEFDGILMDCQMPVMDGYEATQRIRLEEKYKDLPIIALTASVMSEDRERVIASGMNDLIVKPIHPSQMFKTMAQWIVASKEGKKEEMTVQLNQEDIEIAVIEGIDQSKGLVSTNQNKVLYCRLLQKFRINQADFIGQFEEAIKENDMNKAIRLAHTLKGLSGSIGASEVLDKESLLKLLEELKQMLEDDDTDAFKLLEQLKKVKGLDRYDKQLAKITQVLESYDFEAGLTLFIPLYDSIVNNVDRTSLKQELEKK